MTGDSPRKHDLVFLVDVDNTLLDNDRIRADMQAHLGERYGAEARDRYWAIQEQLFVDLGYRDYLGALQRYRDGRPEHIELLAVASWLVDFPFAERLYPGALDVLRHLARFGPTVILTDGDVVFQPRKVQRSGIGAAVEGRVLVYIHKEKSLPDVERRYPAERYVLVDDKPGILAAVKRHWGERVFTVLPRQGQFAAAAGAQAAEPAPDLAVDHIADLLKLDLPALIGGRSTPSPLKASA
jgi:FMN phosphatase YigB (HAD superfamily)